MIKTMVYFYSANETKQETGEEEEKNTRQEEKEEATSPIIYKEEDETEAEGNVSFATNPDSLIQNFQNLIIGLGRGDYDDPIDIDPNERQFCSIYIEGRGWVPIYKRKTVNTFFTLSANGNAVAVSFRQARNVKIKRLRELSIHPVDEPEFFFPAFRLDIFTGSFNDL